MIGNHYSKDDDAMRWMDETVVRYAEFIHQEHGGAESIFRSKRLDRFAILFLFSVIGFVLFYDLEQFQQLHTTLFTLFKATISEYNADQMKEARIGAFFGYAFFLAFMIINLILIMNLIVARLASTYKKYN